MTAVLGACSEPQSVVMTETESDAQFANDDQRVLYALGVVLGQNVTEFNLTAEEAEFVATGLRDAAIGAEYAVDMEFFSPQIQDLYDERVTAVAAAAAAEERQLSAAFADEIAAEEGAERFASGLVFVPMTEGDGEMPSASDTVLVHYHGTLRDGTVFDSSVERGEPISFPLNGVIPCWTEGVQKIAVGGKAKLLCPADIAYGDGGTGPIPGGAALLFEVELLDIVE
ncbi:MAG: FKBP-type peptidyl-prolyl cis-trans isomerase [Gammaproteobacteria bacterium]|nr:FKBP-type peptidyl-prolyl cis-trans isomerase [Gammaproteobacteria bacterium]